MTLVLTQTQGSVLLALACVPLYYIFKKITRNSLDNIPGPQSTSWLYGHFSELYGEKGRQPAFQAEVAAKCGSTFSMQFLLGKRLCTFDPKAMYHIFVKDQMSYEEPDALLRLIRVVFGPGILATGLGDHHRKQRKILNPAFSVAHMKEQVPIFYEVAHKVQNSLIEQVKDGPKEVDMSSWMGRTALELIGQAGLGYSFDDLKESPREDPFAHAIKTLNLILGRLAGVSFLVLPWGSRIGTPGFRRFVCNLFPWWKDLQDAKNLADDMWKMSTDIFRRRKKVLEMGGEEAQQDVGRGRDVLSLLIKENMKATNQDRLTEEELIAQMTTLINAATDTTSTGLSQALQLLANYPDVQRKLREEIDEAFQDGDASYDKLVSLPYLDAISRETLRMYPPFSKIARVAKHDVVLPLSTPVMGLDGFLINEIHVPKNTEIHCSVINGNRNPDVWGPDAAEWRPERWLQPLPKSVTDANMPGVYSHMMTFSAGQRSCIGFKFSQLEMKVVLALLVKTFEFSDAGKEIVWELAPISSPSVKDTGLPGMPIIMNLVKRD